MGRRNRPVLPSYDFAESLSLTCEERLQRSVETIRGQLISEGRSDIDDIPPVPATGASSSELQRLEAGLGITLPAEYRACLARWRYLDLGTGLQVWGLDHEGVSIGSPWVSQEHRQGSRLLVFGNYWNYADGDQLYFDVDDPTESVYVYLHAHGPAYEFFSPSFSTGLWRMVHEQT